MAEKSPRVSTRTKVFAPAKSTETATETNERFAERLILDGSWPVAEKDMLLSVLNHLDGEAKRGNPVGKEKTSLMSSINRMNEAVFLNDQYRHDLVETVCSEQVDLLRGVSVELMVQDGQLDKTKNLLMAFKYAACEEADHSHLRGTLYWPDLIEAIEQTLPTLNKVEQGIRAAQNQVDVAQPTVVQASTPQSESTRRREALSTLAAQPA